MNDKNYYLLVLLLILLASILSGCNPTSGEYKNKPPGELMPLQVGNWWEYELTYLSSSNDTVRFEIDRAVNFMIEDEYYTAFAFNQVPFPPETPEYYWLRRNGEAGMYQMGGISETDTLFKNDLLYPYPGEIGDSLKLPEIFFSRQNLNFFLSDTLHITLVDINREVVTPAGMFTCHVYNFKKSAGDDVLEELDYYLFYSPGVGLIKQEERGESDQRIISKLELLSYEVNE